MEEYTDHTNPFPSSKSRITSSKLTKKSQNSNTGGNHSTLVLQTQSLQAQATKQPADSIKANQLELRKKSIKKHIM